MASLAKFLPDTTEGDPYMQSSTETQSGYPEKLGGPQERPHHRPFGQYICAIYTWRLSSQPHPTNIALSLLFAVIKEELCKV